SAFTGISFWAKGDATVTFSVATHETVPNDVTGGSCAAECHNQFAAPTITLTDDLTKYSHSWLQLAQASSWGTPATGSSADISKLQWQVAGGGADEGAPFTIKLDSISFTPRGDEPEPNPTTTDTAGDTDGDTDGADTDGADTDGVDTDDVVDTDTDGAGA